MEILSHVRSPWEQPEYLHSLLKISPKRKMSLTDFPEWNCIYSYSLFCAYLLIHGRGERFFCLGLQHISRRMQRFISVKMFILNWLADFCQYLYYKDLLETEGKINILIFLSRTNSPMSELECKVNSEKELIIRTYTNIPLSEFSQDFSLKLQLYDIFE